jgi:hypothetical protein
MEYKKKVSPPECILFFCPTESRPEYPITRFRSYHASPSLGNVAKVRDFVGCCLCAIDISQTIFLFRVRLSRPHESRSPAVQVCRADRCLLSVVSCLVVGHCRGCFLDRHFPYPQGTKSPPTASTLCPQTSQPLLRPPLHSQPLPKDQAISIATHWVVAGFPLVSSCTYTCIQQTGFPPFATMAMPVQHGRQPAC